jgi:4-carboxymuconolactone decarboxylase
VDVDSRPPGPRGVPLIDPHASDGPVRDLLARVESAVGSVTNLHRTLGHAPALMGAWTEFSDRVRYAPGVGRALRELAILRTAQLAGAQYVWKSHLGAAARAGLDASRVEALRDWAGSTVFSATERAVLALVDDAVDFRRLDDPAWTAASTVFGPERTVELIVTVGWYTCVATVTKALAVPPEASHAGYPPLRPVENG